MNRRNVTVDVKHYEDCEQLFLSVGKCFVVEAFLEFFKMADTKQKPTWNDLDFACTISDEKKKIYITNTLDKFLDQYIFVDGNDEITSLHHKSSSHSHKSSAENEDGRFKKF